MHQCQNTDLVEALSSLLVLEWFGVFCFVYLWFCSFGGGFFFFLLPLTVKAVPTRVCKVLQLAKAKQWKGKDNGRGYELFLTKFQLFMICSKSLK